MNKPENTLSEALDTPMQMSTEPYISEAYMREEKDRLWKKVWQIACREEEIPKVGDYYTYDIHDQSIIIARSAPDEISAYYNVCLHRGRRLTKGCGHTVRFHCKYHGWQWTLDGDLANILQREDWGDGLKDENLRMGKVNVGRWAGFVFVNLDPDCESLEAYLETVPHWLDPFQVGKMRYKWRKFSRLPCNWKVAIEAFNEGYHAPITHPQSMQYSSGKTWSRPQGKHGNMGSVDVSGGSIGTSVSKNIKMDARKLAAGAVLQQAETVGALTTDTFIAAAQQLEDVLPETATPEEVGMKMMELAWQIDAQRGIDWPLIDPAHAMEAGINWNVFPNTVLLPNVTFCLGFRVRPDGFNPDSCIFEVYNLERYPEGEEPKPEVEYITELTKEYWPLLIYQDFENMGEVQQGMKSDGLSAVLPNPFSERSVANFRRNLAEYMGRGAPEPYAPD